MSIRYQCDECGSVLKVKDELAGTAGKCPKCKKKFVVPQPSSSTEKSEGTEEKSAKTAKPKSADTTASATDKPKSAAKPSATKSPETTPADSTQSAKPKAKPSADDDFDVDAFLMADGPIATPPADKPAAEPATTGRSGRKRIVPEMPGEDPASGAVGGKAADVSAASANARDLLTKTMDDARVKSAGLPEGEAKEPFFDFSGVREEAKQAAPYAIGFVFLLSAVWWMSSSMFDSSMKLPPLARVSGTVTVDGKPFQNVKVNLTPVDRKIEIDGKEMRLRTATGVTDENGYYELEYVQGIKGAYVGKSRIWLEANELEDIKLIPAQYISISNDIREVREAGNEGKFNLELASPRPDLN